MVGDGSSGSSGDSTTISISIAAQSSSYRLFVVCMIVSQKNVRGLYQICLELELRSASIWFLVITDEATKSDTDSAMARCAVIALGLLNIAERFKTTIGILSVKTCSRNIVGKVRYCSEGVQMCVHACTLAKRWVTTHFYICTKFCTCSGIHDASTAQFKPGL